MHFGPFIIREIPFESRQRFKSYYRAWCPHIASEVVVFIKHQTRFCRLLSWINTPVEVCARLSALRHVAEPSCQLLVESGEPRCTSTRLSACQRSASAALMERKCIQSGGSQWLPASIREGAPRQSHLNSRCLRFERILCFSNPLKG